MQLFNRLSIVLLAFLTSVAQAQFGFFDQMFGGGQQQEPQRPQNVPSDSSIYQSNFDRMTCDNYLCPDTLGKRRESLPGNLR
jgi:hypothetical protein